MAVTLDNLDARILEELQEDATVSMIDLAEKVGSSKSVVWRRVQTFIEEGVIDRQVAILNPKKVGCDVTVFALVKMLRHNSNALPKFIESVQAIPQVMECHTVLGHVDFMLKIVTGSIEEYRDVVWTKLAKLEVQEISSMISIEQSVNRTKLPLRHIGS